MRSFTGGLCTVRSLQNEVVMIGKLRYALYVVHAVIVSKCKLHKYFLVGTLDLWHKRMDHVSQKSS